MSTIWNYKAIYRDDYHHHHYQTNFSVICLIYPIQHYTTISFLIYCEETEEEEEKKLYRWKRPPGGTDIQFSDHQKLIFVMKLCMCMLMVHHSIHSKLRVKSHESIAHSHFTPPYSGRNYFTALIY